jgi:serine/threonine protein phosphatase 1
VRISIASDHAGFEEKELLRSYLAELGHEVIDRGPDSKGVIDYIISLQDAGYDVNCLRGNHEDYCIRTWEDDQKRFLFRSKLEKDWRKNGGDKTLLSFDAKRPREINKFYIEWMKNAKYYIKLND